MISLQQPDTTLPKQKTIRTYSVLITQQGTAAPTIIMLHNTINPVMPAWVRTGVGVYTLTYPEIEATNTQVFITPSANPGITILGYATVGNKVEIRTYNSADAAADEQLIGTSLEIRLYNI